MLQHDPKVIAHPPEVCTPYLSLCRGSLTTLTRRLIIKGCPSLTPVLLFSKQVPQSAFIQNITFNTQNPTFVTVMPPLDTASISLLEGWPKDMYLVENKANSIIKCGVSGCDTFFRTQSDMTHLVGHYAYPGTGSDRFKIEHGLRHQMHTLNTCLVCGEVYHSYPPDARRLFYHVISQHPFEAENISTLQWFLVFVRKFPSRVPVEVRKEKEYQKKTFKLAFDHLVLSLTAGIWGPLFKSFMGYHLQTAVPEYVLLQTFIRPGETEFFPVLPDDFLTNVQYDPERSGLTPEEWQGIRSKLQELYSIGSI